MFSTQQSIIPPNALSISNLHYNVNEDDLYELFGQLGQVRIARILRKPDGRPNGGAFITFAQPKDAERAMHTYNNVELDGRPMRISCGSGVQQPAAFGGPMRRPMRSHYNNPMDKHHRPRPDIKPKATQEELDAEMDSYMETRLASSNDELKETT
ncbi:hypothetical protein DFQ30_003856 [Apophysomyces sp. BC1015]|nr:hypothetical protein DFQ30_003856 [Apophysomyces sp. BC1015]